MSNFRPVTGLPGHLALDEELEELGFTAHELAFAGEIVLPTGVGRSWTTLGEVPDSPGLYAFTVADGGHQHVTYVGRTANLWMVTKGRLPRSGGARPGQRYGRPLYAGSTRQRVNMLVAAELAHGRRVRHWLCPLHLTMLVTEEERLIRHWRLREIGWNRG